MKLFGKFEIYLDIPETFYSVLSSLLLLYIQGKHAKCESTLVRKYSLHGNAVIISNLEKCLWIS